MRETTVGLTGHVTINERNTTHRFNRYVDERMKDWVREMGLSAEGTQYEVAFFDEEPLDETSCLIVVHSGDQLWRSWETADNPRQALKMSLENLKPEPIDDSEIIEREPTTH